MIRSHRCSLPHFCIVFLLIFTACTTQGKDISTSEGMPSREHLLEKLWTTQHILMVYGTADEANAARYADLLGQIKASENNLQVTIRRDDEVTEQELETLPLYLYGTPKSNRLIAEIAEGLPAKFSDRGITFHEKTYEATANPVFSLRIYPQPNRTDMPLTLMAGLDDADVIAQLERNISGDDRNSISWGYAVRKDGEVAVMGFFERDEVGNWNIGNRHWDFEAANIPSGESKHFHIYRHPAQSKTLDSDAVANKMDQRIAQWEAFTGRSYEGEKLDLHMYETPELKGMMTGNVQHAHIGPKDKALHMVVHPQWAGIDDANEGRILARKLLGKPASPLLETGLAVYMTERWQRKGYAYWAGRIFATGNGIAFSELLDEKRLKEGCNIVFGAAAAVLVSVLIDTHGKEAFLDMYTTWTPPKKGLQKLEKDWIAAGKRLMEAYRASGTPPQRQLRQDYLKGFNFAHEGYQIYNGYISNAATQSLCYNSDSLHCNTTAIIPYSGMRNPRKPSGMYLNRWAGGECDESVVHAAWSARKAGMSAMLKPQVWIHGSWPGDVDMATEADWKAWFENYYRWMRHYALLAEVHEMDVLCIGVEFAQATIKREQDWRHLIAKLRGLYSGPLTYAANWGEEFENLRFWDALDFIGLNSYYPLSHKENASDAELEKGFQKVIEKARAVSERYDRRIAFTEIGFRSVKGAWQEPHAEIKGKSSNYEHQLRCYRVMREALKDQDWCLGVYLWKWPAYMEHWQGKNGAYTPKGKPALGVVKDWFEMIP